MTTKPYIVKCTSDEPVNQDTRAQDGFTIFRCEGYDRDGQYWEYFVRFFFDDLDPRRGGDDSPYGFSRIEKIDANA